MQMPPPTPCNASHLYGEFSWPSLDVATLLETLDDLAEEKDQQQDDIIVEKCDGVRVSVWKEAAKMAFGEGLKAMDEAMAAEEERERRDVEIWLEGLVGGADGVEEEGSVCCSCDEEAADGIGKEEAVVDDDDDYDDDTGFEGIGTLERKELAELLDLLGLRGQAEEKQMRMLSKRDGRDKRGGVCIV
ncbi:MAG: hypothetical protein L6R40_004406 [Gallowayella cf. fulva]|nr:MAG: hypothetical protein L6R40_004406 [Xanthomendoza cf. fulva]